MLIGRCVVLTQLFSLSPSLPHPALLSLSFLASPSSSLSPSLPHPALFSLLPCLIQPLLSLPVATLSTPGSQTLPRNSSCEVYSLTRSLLPCLTQLFSLSLLPCLTQLYLSPSLPHPALLSPSLPHPALLSLSFLASPSSISLLPCLTQPSLSFLASPSSSLSHSFPASPSPPLSHSSPASPSPLSLSSLASPSPPSLTPPLPHPALPLSLPVATLSTSQMRSMAHQDSNVSEASTVIEREGTAYCIIEHKTLRIEC